MSRVEKIIITLLIICLALISVYAYPRLSTGGDCDDYALASYNMLETFGFSPVIKYSSNGVTGHVWVETDWFRYDNGIIRFDTIEGKVITLETLKQYVEEDK